MISRQRGEDINKCQRHVTFIMSSPLWRLIILISSLFYRIDKSHEFRFFFTGLCRFYAYDNTSTTIFHLLNIHGAATSDRIHKNTV